MILTTNLSLKVLKPTINTIILNVICTVYQYYYCSSSIITYLTDK